MPRSARRLLVLAALVGGPGCIEERLNVDVATYVHADGSCARRVEYRLQRVDTEKGEGRVALPPAEDLLRLYHRFPQGDAWSVRDEPQADLHSVLLEATLPSPNAIGWDYWSQRSPRAAPARNHVEFAMSGDDRGTVYEYLETFLDPASPLEGMRVLARLLLKRDDEFSRRLEREMGSRAPRFADIKRAYRERFALPFSREVEAIGKRPLYGPRERKDVEDLVTRLDELQKDLVQTLVAASPVAAPAEVDDDLDRAFEAIGETVQQEITASGLPAPVLASERALKLHFRVTLVMPGTIVRANTCAQGDTATWEFDGEDLYGRGFEMWARAVSR